MKMLFLGGPLDGQWREVDLPLTETVALLEDEELVQVETYAPLVRPYYLHTVLAEIGIMPIYSTTPDFLEFGDQLATHIPPEPVIGPADLLPLPAEISHED